MEDNVREELQRWLSRAERVSIVGVGNPILMDDSVGIRVVQDLRGKLPNKVLLIECETTPENYLQEIIEFKPTHVLIVDAAMLNLKPGEIAFIGHENLEVDYIVSTHFLPIKLFCEYITRTLHAEIKLLLIQPKQIDFGEGLSNEVLLSKERIVRLILSIFSEKTPSNFEISKLKEYELWR